jgi:hypothetical protein
VCALSIKAGTRALIKFICHVRVWIAVIVRPSVESREAEAIRVRVPRKSEPAALTAFYDISGAMGMNNNKQSTSRVGGRRSKPDAIRCASLEPRELNFGLEIYWKFKNAFVAVFAVDRSSEAPSEIRIRLKTEPGWLVAGWCLGLISH